MDTSQRILDVAERLVQTRGYNGFSYADISEELGITKASLHYHFASKADLGTTLIGRYSVTFSGALDSIDAAETDAREKLHRYVDLYEQVLRRDRMCLCGMLASDYNTLPKPMREGVRQFFDLNERWLGQVFTEGRRQRVLKFAGPPLEAGRLLLGSLEGAMLVARSYGSPARFSAAARSMLAAVCLARKHG